MYVNLEAIICWKKWREFFALTVNEPYLIASVAGLVHKMVLRAGFTRKRRYFVVLPRKAIVVVRKRLLLRPRALVSPVGHDRS